MDAEQRLSSLIYSTFNSEQSHMQNPAQYVYMNLRRKVWKTVKQHISYILSSKRGKLAGLVGTYYGMALASSGVRLSVGLSRKLVNTIQTELFQLGRSNLYAYYYDKRSNLIDFQGHGSKVKVSR